MCLVTTIKNLLPKIAKYGIIAIILPQIASICQHLPQSSKKGLISEFRFVGI